MKVQETCIKLGCWFGGSTTWTDFYLSVAEMQTCQEWSTEIPTLCIYFVGAKDWTRDLLYGKWVLSSELPTSNWHSKHTVEWPLWCILLVLLWTCFGWRHRVAWGSSTTTPWMSHADAVIGTSCTNDLVGQVAQGWGHTEVVNVMSCANSAPWG